jgi:geranylgeranyl reductase family protein
MQRSADVVVVGGGPAGCVAAVELARRGISVLLLEAERYPRDKVCGDGLIPDAIGLLDSMKLLERVRAEAHAPRSVRVFAPSGRSVALEAPLLTLPRARFDALLAEAAVDAGAELCVARAKQPILDDRGMVGGVHAETPEGALDVSAPITILAKGANARLLERFGARLRSQPSALAMRAYYEVPEIDASELIISYEKAVMPGYGWVFPMGRGQANVGVGLFLVDGVTGENLRELFERFLTSCPHVKHLMQHARALSPVRGAPLRCNLSGALPARDGLLLAGETLGTTYALSGEGIGKAMESGRLAAIAAADALALGRFDALTLGSYERALSAAGFPAKFAQYEAAQRWVRHSAIIDVLTWRAQKSAGLRAMLEALIREELAPDRIFSVGGMLRALVA